MSQKENYIELDVFISFHPFRITFTQNNFCNQYYF